MEENNGQLLQRLGNNGMAWAKEMNKHFPCVSVDDLLGWCCNMIENALVHDPLRQRLGEKATKALLEGKAAVVPIGALGWMSFQAKHDVYNFPPDEVEMNRLDKKQEKNDGK